jgi:dTDP-4-dehydrorhamnose reductase
VRTAWLFGPDGNCFPKTILRAAAVRPELRVVADQQGCPTYTHDLACALVHLIRTPQYGTYHITNQGTATWYTFADRLLTLAGKTETRVLPIRSADWKAPARRPANSVLRNHALLLRGEPLLRPWEEALTAFLADYGATLSI